MPELYIIGVAEGIDEAEAASVRDVVEFELPDDYLVFVREYGYGTVDDELIVVPPDRDHVGSTFSVEDFLTIWDWPDEHQARIARQGAATVATTNDGDIVCCTDGGERPYLLLPRHSSVPIWFGELSSVMRHLGIDPDEASFEPACTRVETISLVRGEHLDKTLVDTVHGLFLDQYAPDRVLGRDDQPRYVIQSIGGYVRFDLVYRSSISVVYAPRFEQQALGMVSFIEGLVRPRPGRCPERADHAARRSRS